MQELASIYKKDFPDQVLDVSHSFGVGEAWDSDTFCGATAWVMVQGQGDYVVDRGMKKIEAPSAGMVKA